MRALSCRKYGQAIKYRTHTADFNFSRNANSMSETEATSTSGKEISHPRDRAHPNSTLSALIRQAMPDLFAFHDESKGGEG